MIPWVWYVCSIKQCHSKGSRCWEIEVMFNNNNMCKCSIKGIIHIDPACALSSWHDSCEHCTLIASFMPKTPHAQKVVFEDCNPMKTASSLLHVRRTQAALRVCTLFLRNGASTQTHSKALFLDCLGLVGYEAVRKKPFCKQKCAVCIAKQI